MVFPLLMFMDVRIEILIAHSYTASRIRICIRPLERAEYSYSAA